MKKLLSILLLLSLVFSMVACQNNESDVPTPQEPTNVGYVPYQLYYYATLALCDDFPLPEKCLDDFLKYNFQVSGSGSLSEITKQSYPSFVLSMNGLDYLFEPYPGGIYCDLYLHGLVPYQGFVSRDGMFALMANVSNNDGSILFIENLNGGYDMTHEVNMKEKTVLVENFIKTVAPDVDLNDYSLNILDSGEGFYYEKRCAGLLTSDYIKVFINRYGGIDTYVRGESIDMERLLEIGVDRERIEQVIDAYITQVCSQCDLKLGKTIIWDADFRIITLEDGTYAVCGSLKFDSNTTKLEPHVGILIPIGK